MDGIEKTVKQIVENNRQFREANNNRFSKLLDVMQSGSADDFTRAINDIFDEVTDGEGDEILGDDGIVESTDGSVGDATDAMGGQTAPQE